MIDYKIEMNKIEKFATNKGTDILIFVLFALTVTNLTIIFLELFKKIVFLPVIAYIHAAFCLIVLCCFFIAFILKIKGQRSYGIKLREKIDEIMTKE